MGEFHLTTPARVRAAIASHLVGAHACGAVGEVVLHPHQSAAVERLTRMLSENGGALLADDVGLGKTYVALAIARTARRPVIVSPAALRSTWAAALERTGIRAHWLSVESLSRREATTRGDLVIIDEAHHLRNPHTKRFAAAAALCEESVVLLLTATPVQNRVEDLRALLSLYLGVRAYAMADTELAAHCIRRSTGDIPADLLRLPDLREPSWLPPVHDADCLERILALPPPVVPLGASDGGVLTAYTLVRQWSSSRAALRQALLRRLARGLALEAALFAGRLPSRSELTAWVCAGTDMQLAFPELVAGALVADHRALLAQVRVHLDGLRALVAWLDSASDPDIERAEILRRVVEQHRGERIVAFSEHHDTIARMYALLAPHVRCAMLTHAGGRVAGGPMTRPELLRRFDPATVDHIATSDRVDVLLTTDVLSEGVNLHAASVVVHLDLAWNPARLAQRVGRLRRIGAARSSVTVLLFPPPASSDRLLQLHHVLRSKLGIVSATVGSLAGVLPGVAGSPRSQPLERNERIARHLLRWRDTTHTPGRVAAAVRACNTGHRALGCVRLNGTTALVAIDESLKVTEDPHVIEMLLTSCESVAVGLTRDDLTPVEEAIRHWMAAKATSGIIDSPSLGAARSRTAVLRRANAIARRGSRQEQVGRAPLLAAARDVASVSLSAGAEYALAKLAEAPLADVEWLHAVSALAVQAHARRRSDPDILALLLLRR